MSRVRRFFNQWRDRALDREFDDELRFHLEARRDATLRRGLTLADAETEARRHLGSTLRAREGMREARVSRLMEDVARDSRHAVRGLRRNPAFAVAVAMLLALGIGAATSMFSVVNAVLIRPLPYPDSDSLVRIVHFIGGVEQPYFSDAIYLTYTENTRTFQDIGVWSPGGRATITGHGAPEEVRALTASRGVLTTLGVRQEIGRWFSAADDSPGTPDTVILMGGYWHRRFGGDRGVLEQALTINGRLHQIIGVMPSDFRFDRDVDVVLPMRIDRAAPVITFRLLGVARLKHDVTLAQANADVNRILDIWFERPGANRANRARWAPALKPLKDDVVGDIGTMLWPLLGAVAVVLLMACANVGNLLLVRADARRQEFATRAALGAAWTRMARQLLVESLVLALIGVGLGLVLAYLGLRVLVASAPENLPRLAEVSIDSVVLGFALTIAVASGVLFGLVPILKHAQPRLADLCGAGRSGGISRERQRSQAGLVVAQLALALVLLVSAALMIRSFQALRRVDPGFIQPDRVQTFSISIPPTMVVEPERVTRLQHDIVEKVLAIPGVTAAAFTTRLPMGSDRSSAALLVAGVEEDSRRASAPPPNRQVKVISPGMFRTLGTPLVAGRDFTWADLYDVRHVAIVSENLARELWGSPGAALGRRVRELYDEEASWREIVGVAGDVHDDGVHQLPPATIYWPAQPVEALQSMSGYQSRRVSMAIRTDLAGTPHLLDRMREAVWSVNPTLPLAEVRTLDEVYRHSMARTSFALVMMAIAGTMALLLGISGVYGVISYAVSQRRREIGIRLALGAGAHEIQRLFVWRGLSLAMIGIVIGLAAAAVSTRLMQSLLFGIAPLDPLSFAVMPVVLVAAAMLASYVPARRALGVDPGEAMRAE